MNVLSQSHLDWFSKHTTVEDILSWKRPSIDTKKTFETKEQATSDRQVTLFDISSSKESVRQITTDHDVKDTSLDGKAKRTSQLLHETPKKHEVTEKSIADSENLRQEAIDVNDSESQQSKHKDILNSPALEPPEPLQNVKITEEAHETNSSLFTQVDMSKNASIPDTVVSQSNAHKRASSSSVSSEGNLTADTPDLIVDVDSQKTQTQKAPKTPESYAQMEVKGVHDNFKLDTNFEKQNDHNNLGDVNQHNNEIFNEEEEEDEEEEDEIQLVVSNRNSRKDDISQDSSDFNPIMPPPPISPPRNIAPSILSSPLRTQSPFMSRLFQVGSGRERSLKEDSPSPIDFVTTRPKSTTSTSTIGSERGSKFSTTLSQNRVEKRSSDHVPGDIVVSDALPFSQFKKPKISTQKTNAKNNIPPSQTEDDHKKEEAEKTTEEEIPSWALSPELHTHLLNQAGLDPDAIFGRMTPLYLEEIFPTEFTTKIPEQAPQ